MPFSPQPNNQTPLLWSNAGKIVLILLTINVVILFILRQLSDLDVAISLRFFEEMACSDVKYAWGRDETAVRCGEFSSIDIGWLRQIREIGLKVPVWFALSVLAWWIWQSVKPGHRTARGIAIPALGVISILLGPLVLTNLILKSWWGRPRPYITDDFGGAAPYVLPGDISNYCQTNCSFVSGEASAAFWMFWIVPFIPKPWRWIVLLGLVPIVFVISGLRVVFGRHYFSDIVMGGSLTLLVIAVTAWLLQTSGARVLLEKGRNFRR